MADVFNLTAAFDKPVYAAGDTMTLSIKGTVSNGTSAPVSATITVTAADSTTTTLTADSQVGGESLTFAITSVTDTANRVWTISADGLTATAVA
jgi:hypothetical protein